MPLSLAEKCRLREKSRNTRGKWRCQRGHGRICSSCGWLRYAFHSLGLALLSGLQALTPWCYTLKRIGPVRLQRDLLLPLPQNPVAFNALLLLPLVAFIVGPQAAFRPGPAAICTGLELLLTGTGCFTCTIMYHGHYGNTAVDQQCGSSLGGGRRTPRAGSMPCNMPLAYVFTVGVGLFISCITLAYSTAYSSGESYRVGSSSGIHAITIFCSWEYKKELPAEWLLRQSPRSVCGRLRQAAVLGLVWLLYLATALGCAVAIHIFLEFIMQNPEAAGQEAVLLALPLVLGLLNLGFPTCATAWPPWSCMTPRSSCCSSSTQGDQPSGQLAGAAPALAGLAREHRLPHAALLPRLPGCRYLPVLRRPVEPSSIRGPFRTLDSVSEAGRSGCAISRRQAQGFLATLGAQHLLENTFFVFLVFSLLLAVIYLTTQVVRGQRKVFRLLKEQISNEGKNNIFLISKLPSVYQRKDREERSRIGTTKEAAAPPSLLTDERDA
ncbi:Transmembrane channel-like protein 6 [Plecturocebus cupreus]